MSGLPRTVTLGLLAVVLAASPDTAHAQQGCRPLPRGVAGWWPVDGNGNDATLSANHAQLINLDGVRDCVRTGNMSLVNTFGVAAWVNSAVIDQGAYRRIVENSFASHFWLGTDAAGTRVLVPLLPGTKLLRRRQLWVRVGTGGADQHHLQLSDWPRLRMGAPALARDIGRVRA